MPAAVEGGILLPMEYPGDFAKVSMVVVAVGAGYAVVNFLILLPVPGIPGPAALWAWGVVIPTLMAAGHWAVLVFHRHWSDAWWMVALAATLFYALAGFLSFRLILGIWASI